MKTSLLLDTVEMALWSRERDGIPLGTGMVHHHDAGSQYTSFAFTTRLIDASVETIHREGPWRTLVAVELQPSNGSTGTTTSDCAQARGDAPPSSTNLSISKG